MNILYNKTNIFYFVVILHIFENVKRQNITMVTCLYKFQFNQPR